MTKKFATAVYDRKRSVAKTGEGRVEIYVYLGNGQKKYYGVKTCTPFEWKVYQKSPEFKKELELYELICNRLVSLGEEMTIKNLENHMGYVSKKRIDKIKVGYFSSPTGFIDFIQDRLKDENLLEGTLKHYRVVIKYLKSYKKILRIQDLTPEKIKEFDTHLRKEKGVDRLPRTVDAYHKVLNKYCRMLYELQYIERNPYKNPLCKYERGEHRERKPLTEEDLIKLQNTKFINPGVQRACDMFIFCAYTGLSYCDCQNFDFETMVEEVNGSFYIDGERIKNGHHFFTPILPPAMKVLEKYNFHLPKISNQKMNDHLHAVEAQAGINKSMTCHVARHSFATLVLSYDIPIENLARMMGHTNVKTTQVYAKILKKTIERHTDTLIDKMNKRQSELKKAQRILQEEQKKQEENNFSNDFDDEFSIDFNNDIDEDIDIRNKISISRKTQNIKKFKKPIQTKVSKVRKPRNDYGGMVEYIDFD